MPKHDDYPGMITPEQMEMIMKTAEDATPEEVIKMNKSIEDTSEVESEGGDKGYVAEEKDVSIDIDKEMESLLAGYGDDELPTTKANIFEVAKDYDNLVKDQDVQDRAKNLVESMNADMSDEEVVQIMSTLSKYKKYKEDKSADKMPVDFYTLMPDYFKKSIQDLAREQGIPWTEYNRMAKMFMDEILSQAELDTIFVDFEKALDEALKIPTIADMYSEHTKDVMDVKIPEIIEKIKDTEPENAKLLQDIKDRFNQAYSLSLLKTHYEENARTRKLMRRDWTKIARFCDEFNLMNSRSKFKMPDCRAIGPALDRAFLSSDDIDPESRAAKMNITETDLCKFIVLFTRSCMNMQPDNILDAAYMYYALRNITMLRLTNENKTPFAAELINNICDIIEFVREKEDQFDANKPDKREHNRKGKHR